MFTPLRYDKKISDRSIQGIAMWNSREKIKLAIPQEQNYVVDWSKTAKQFSVNSHGKFLCQYQASRRAGKQAVRLEPFFLRILDAFHIFKLLF